MHFPSLYIPVVSATLVTFASGVSLTYDTIYDDGKRSLSEVACWDPNVPGLFRDHDDWVVQENVSPGILAIPTITGWDHPDCISCWMAVWDGPEGSEMARPLLAIDRSEKGYVTSFERMNSLTNGQADSLKTVEVNITRVSLTNCGFAPGDARRTPSDEL
ncbi:hypothetical protein ACHAQA_009416 [Verticillium albo-atrum]